MDWVETRLDWIRFGLRLIALDKIFVDFVGLDWIGLHRIGLGYVGLYRMEFDLN